MLYPYQRECGKRNLSASTGGTPRNSSLRFPDGTGTLSVDWTDRSVQHTPGEIRKRDSGTIRVTVDVNGDSTPRMIAQSD
jgi:hypothetical protein